MRYTVLSLAVLSASIATAVHADGPVVDGMISVKSASDVQTTGDRLAGILTEKGMKLMARVNHTKGASSVGLALRPTELFIFGNPKAGTPLMLCSQSIAIDLPQKALIWEDDEGQVWFSYNDPAKLKERHNVEGCDKVLAKVAGALAGIAAAATGT